MCRFDLKKELLTIKKAAIPLEWLYSTIKINKK
jgi:hypothetical protein